MNNKLLNILSILCLIAIVSIMSWRDMHPKIETDTSPSALGMLAYYAGDNVTPAMAPDDSSERLPITIGLGDFSYTPDGKVIWTPHGMPPATFAQRQVNLQFHFKDMPRDPAETISKIKAVADEWVHKGDTVNTLILDYSPEKADLKAYAALLKAAHSALKKNYVIYAGVNILWAEGPQKDVLKDLQDSSPQFLIHLTQAQISPELLSKLQAFKYNFIMQFPAGVQLKDIDMATLKKLGSLTGITLTLDPHKPLPVKEEKVGLFPKL
jgi:hypothetical protein